VPDRVILLNIMRTSQNNAFISHQIKYGPFVHLHPFYFTFLSLRSLEFLMADVSFCSLCWVLQKHNLLSSPAVINTLF